MDEPAVNIINDVNNAFIGAMPCIERLQKEAEDCLNTFPKKVTDLNEVIEKHTPSSVDTKCGGYKISTRRAGTAKSLNSADIVPESPKSPTSEFPESINFHCGSILSTATNIGTTIIDRCDRDCSTRRSIYRRRCYPPMRGCSGFIVRRRPGPLSQLLAFIAKKFALCAKAYFIGPSYFLLEGILSVFNDRPQVKNAQCGPSCDSKSRTTIQHATDQATNAEHPEIDSTWMKLVNVMRPSAVQLIADTGILKRWLQALQTISSKSKPPSTALLEATRTVETIDYWAYELFFHLKYLRTDQARNAEAISQNVRMSDEVTHINLWHRMLQLRNNYVIMYETLCVDDPKFFKPMHGEGASRDEIK